VPSGAGAQDAASGYLIEGFKRGTGTAARYDFLPVSVFWVGAAVVSMLITAMNSRASRRPAA